MDINWRNNGFGANNCTKDLPGLTCEYYYNQTNTTRLPNITDLFAFEHTHGLKVYLNDHPMHMGDETSPEEIKFRCVRSIYMSYNPSSAPLCLGLFMHQLNSAIIDSKVSENITN